MITNQLLYQLSYAGVREGRKVVGSGFQTSPTCREFAEPAANLYVSSFSTVQR